MQPGNSDELNWPNNQKDQTQQNKDGPDFGPIWNSGSQCTFSHFITEEGICFIGTWCTHPNFPLFKSLVRFYSAGQLMPLKIRKHIAGRRLSYRSVFLLQHSYSLQLCQNSEDSGWLCKTLTHKINKTWNSIQMLLKMFWGPGPTAFEAWTGHISQKLQC